MKPVTYWKKARVLKNWLKSSKYLPSPATHFTNLSANWEMPRQKNF